MTTSALSNYLNHLGDYPLINASEEIALAKKIEAGSESAIQKLTLANLRLVITIAKQFANKGVPLSELIAAGNHGLSKAARRFRLGHGAKFSSYASWWIKQTVRRAITDHSRIVRVPIQSLLRMQKIKNAKLKISQKNGSANDLEIAREVGITPSLVKSTRIHVDTSTFSLNESTSSDDHSRERAEMIPDTNAPSPEELVEYREGYQTFMQIIRQELNEREYTIIEARFGLDDGVPKTLNETSERVGLTSERVRQLQHDVLRRLRHTLAPHQLQDLINKSISLN